MTAKKSAFHVAAKDLRDAVRSDDPVACARARAVWRDLAGVEDVAVKERVGLQRAQHVVARELGFADWAEPLHKELRR